MADCWRGRFVLDDKDSFRALFRLLSSKARDEGVGVIAIVASGAIAVAAVVVVAIVAELLGFLLSSLFLPQMRVGSGICRFCEETTGNGGAGGEGLSALLMLLLELQPFVGTVTLRYRG